MFIVFTADDAIQSYTLNAVNQFLAHRKNPNGCSPRMTYYTSLNYTNYTLVTDWYVVQASGVTFSQIQLEALPSESCCGSVSALSAVDRNVSRG